MVLGLSVHTLGGVVAPGTTLLEIVPENQQLMVDAEVSPVEAQATAGIPLPRAIISFTIETSTVIPDIFR